MIGAGPAGLSAAWELLARGRDRFDVDVLEADPVYVGGIARTARHGGYRFDIGGHRFFSKSEEIEALWTEIAGVDMLTRQRLSRIYYERRFFCYPLRPANALLGLGPLRSARVLASYARARARPIRPEVSFADWVTNRFGRQLYEIFFRSYTEKVWGIPCTELSADWAAQRIKGLSLTRAVRDAFVHGPGRGGDVVKTLVETFRYPRLGPGMMWEKARDRIEAWGGRVHMDRAVSEVHVEGSRVVRVAAQSTDGAIESFDTDHVISSMSLRDLVRCLRPPPPQEVADAAGRLRFRDFLTVVLIADRADLFPDTWIYVHEPGVRVGRLQNFGNWSPEMVPNPGTTCLGMEYFCNEGDALWSMPDDELIALGTREIARLGLAAEREILDGTVVRMPQAYPVYDEGYAARVDLVRRWLLLDAGNVQTIGRSGMHRYNNQDHSMMTGLLAARNLMGGSWDVWKVNTDAEYLEEVRGDTA